VTGKKFSDSLRGMKMKAFLMALALCFALGTAARADQAPNLTEAQKDEIAKSLKYQTGTITLKNGLATIHLTDDFKFLGPEDSRKVLHDLSGNPDDPEILGMIFPKKSSDDATASEWAVTIHYDEGGYVRDDDAGTINYDDLLKKMQQEVLDGNAERAKEGYRTAELVGWAAQPHYDKASHKLYWAKELKFGNDPEETLNYDIRILGRRGVLVLTVIAAQSDFPQINDEVPSILSMVDFQPGNTYADFDPKIDKVAEYGLTALIAGGALAGAAKLGLFGLALKGLIAGWKFILIGLAAIVAGAKKLWGKFSGKSKTPDHLLPPR
jgi:uncharacterized membrane-anchored protein